MGAQQAGFKCSISPTLSESFWLPRFPLAVTTLLCTLTEANSNQKKTVLWTPAVTKELVLQSHELTSQKALGAHTQHFQCAGARVTDKADLSKWTADQTPRYRGGVHSGTLSLFKLTTLKWKSKVQIRRSMQRQSISELSHGRARESPKGSWVQMTAVSCHPQSHQKSP